MKKVVKFGGSSLASAEQFKKVGDIIRADEGRRYVVPSAPGKRNSADTKVTDMLYDCYRTAVAGRDFKKKLQNIKARYQEIIDGLNLSLDLSPEFEKIAENFAAAAGEDYAASRGEYLNGIVMANYLGYTYIDSAEVICFDENGNFLADKTDEVLSERLKDLDNAVVPGFYGAKPDGSVKTFSRGGSDITGSIVAKAVHADIYENWTDVSGFLVTDPRIVKDPEVISTITYRELRELSYMGATVLHEDSIFPLRQEGIPIHVLNTNAPQDPGTMIVENTCSKPKFTITGIAGKKGFASITIEKSMMNTEIKCYFAVCFFRNECFFGSDIVSFCIGCHSDATDCTSSRHFRCCIGVFLAATGNYKGKYRIRIFQSFRRVNSCNNSSRCFCWR